MKRPATTSSINKKGRFLSIFVFVAFFIMAVSSLISNPAFAFTINQNKTISFTSTTHCDVDWNLESVFNFQRDANRGSQGNDYSGQPKAFDDWLNHIKPNLKDHRYLIYRDKTNVHIIVNYQNIDKYYLYFPKTGNPYLTDGSKSWNLRDKLYKLGKNTKWQDYDFMLFTISSSPRDKGCVDYPIHISSSESSFPIDPFNHVSPQAEIYRSNFVNKYQDGYTGPVLPKTGSSESVEKKSIYPRFFVMVTSDRGVYANLDFEYFKNNNIPVPDHNIFFLIKPDGSIVKTPTITNGLSVWENIEKGDYRLILHSSYLNNDQYKLEPVYFDLQVGKYDHSYFIHFNNEKNRYCMFSNRLKNVTSENIENIKKSGSIWSGFLNSLLGSSFSVSPAESYFRCDIPQPDQNTKPDDFSSFNPQGLTEYSSVCELTDINCHFSKFFTAFLNFLKWIFIPSPSDIKVYFDNFYLNIRESIGGAFGFVQSLVMSFASFASLIYPTLFDVNYSPPCNFIPSFSFFGQPFSIDLCKFEQSMGYANFNKIKSFVSVTFVFIALFLSRNIVLKFFRMVGGSS